MPAFTGFLEFRNWWKSGVCPCTSDVVMLKTMTFYSGMRLLYLPAYSPDLNPVEEAFSVIKGWMRSNRDYILGEMDGPGCDPYTLTWEAVYSTVTPEKAHGWYRHSEYIA
jgi:hypothetical protein